MASKSGTLHRASTGVNAGKWVTCPAKLNCRNGGVHISREDMNQLKEEMKQRVGHFVPTTKISDEAVQWFYDKEKQTTALQDATVEGENLTQQRMVESQVKPRLSQINSLTGKRSRNFDAAAKAVLEKYEQMKDAPDPDEYVNQLANEIKGSLDNMPASVGRQLITAEYNGNTYLTISSTYEPETEEQYNNIVEQENQGQGNPETIVTPTWKDIVQKFEDEQDNYDDDYYYYEDDNAYYFESIQRFKLTPEQRTILKNAQTKKAIERNLLPQAKSEHLPNWSLSADNRISLATNTVYRIRYLRRANNTQHATLQRKLKIAQTAARTRAKLLSQKELLDNEIAQANKMLETAEVPVVKTALTEYVTSKKKDLAVLTPKIKRAESGGSNAKIVALEEEIREFETKHYSKESSEEETKLWNTVAQEWLATKFPSNNGVHRNSEAKKWLKTHPQAVNEIKKIYETNESW